MDTWQTCVHTYVTDDLLLNRYRSRVREERFMVRHFFVRGQLPSVAHTSDPPIAQRSLMKSETSTKSEWMHSPHFSIAVSKNKPRGLALAYCPVLPSNYAHSPISSMIVYLNYGLCTIPAAGHPLIRICFRA